jgi:hypothetical protein
MDLVINKMTTDAFRQNLITVSNPNSYRSCLGTKDLNRAVTAILNNLDKINENTCLYNLCSFNDSIGEISNKISIVTGAKVEYAKDSQTYNFSMSTKKFIDKFSFSFNETVETIVSDLSTLLID